jgi:hypothetical protein
MNLDTLQLQRATIEQACEFIFADLLLPRKNNSVMRLEIAEKEQCRISIESQKLSAVSNR